MLSDRKKFEGKCDLSTPPKSWSVTTAVGILKWATAGMPTDGKNYCVTGTRETLLEVDYHINLPENSLLRATPYLRNAQKLWDNPDNHCVMEDPKIHVCFPMCSTEWQPTVIKAALSSGYPHTVANSIKKSLNLPDWAILVLQVDFNNPKTHLNVSAFAEANIWCSVYIGVDPRFGFPYLYEIQIAKVILS